MGISINKDDGEYRLNSIYNSLDKRQAKTWNSLNDDILHNQRLASLNPKNKG